MDNKEIKIRVDEWCTRVETTSEGTFIYVNQEDKEEVMEELVRVLEGECCG